MVEAGKAESNTKKRGPLVRALRSAVAAGTAAMQLAVSPAHSELRQAEPSEITRFFEKQEGAQYKKFWKDIQNIMQYLKPYSELMTCPMDEPHNEESDQAALPESSQNIAKDLEEIILELRNKLDKFGWIADADDEIELPNEEEMRWADEVASAFQRGEGKLEREELEKFNAYLSKKYGCHISSTTPAVSPT